MKKHIFVLMISALAVAHQSFSQNPFESLGVKNIKVLTFSNGKYNEFFDNDSIVQIGSVLFNTKSNEVVAFVQSDTTYSEANLKPEITSRWLSPDPLAAKYPFISPYAFANNNPILFIDQDGREVFLYNATDYDKTGNLVFKAGQVSQKTQQVLTDMMKTDEGRTFVGQFAFKGQTIGGYTFSENGILSKNDLIITDVSLTDFDYSTNIPISTEGSFSTSINEDKNNVRVDVQLMSFSHNNKYDLGETATHEMQLHGFKADDEVKAFETGGIAGFAKEKKNSSGVVDHSALKNNNMKHEGFRRYENMKRQLSGIDPKYKTAFDKEEKKKTD